MATVIEEALIAIRPDFSQFKTELAAGLKEATAGTSAKVSVDADTATLAAKVRAAASEAGRGATAKIKADVDTAPATAKLKALSAETVTVKAKVDTEGGLWSSPTRQRMLQQQIVDVVNAQKAAQRQVVADERAADAERVRSAAKAAKDIADAQKAARRQMVADERAAEAERVRFAKQAEKDEADAQRRREVVGKAEAAAYRERDKREKNAQTQGFRLFAEYLNVLPGIGGVGPHAARTIAAGITAGAPLIGAAITSAVALGVGTLGIATGIAISAADPRVKREAADLAASLGTTLRGAARPFSDELVSVIPKVGADVAALKPQIAATLTPLAATLPNIEAGLAGMARAAMPGMAVAAQNAAKYIDAIAAKAPQIGAAFSTLITDLTDPAGIKFLTGLIDFIDRTVVAVGELVKAFAQINEFLNPIYHIVGAVVGSLLTLVENMSDVFGAPMVAGVLTVAAAVAVFGNRVLTAGKGAKTAWTEARLAWTEYQKAVQTGSKADAALAVGTKVIPAGLRGKLATGGLLAASVVADVAGGALTDAGHPVAGAALQGLGNGAMLGSFIPGVGAPIGAAVGAGLGALTGAMGEQQKSTDTLSRSFRQLGDEYKATGTVSTQTVTQLMQQDKVLQDLALHADRYGTKLPQVIQAMVGGDPKQIDAVIGKLKEAQRKATPGIGFHSLDPTYGGPEARRVQSVIDALTDQKNVGQAVQDALNGGLTPALDQAGDAWARIRQAASETTSVYDVFQQKVASQRTAESQSVNAITDVYASFRNAQRGLADAQYSRVQIAQQGAISDEAALHGVAEAEHNLAQAHFATEQAQKSLTQARKDAIQNLKELSRQVRDIGDNEEELKIRLVQAQLAEVQTRGLPTESLARRQAVVALDEAQHALADFRADTPTLRAKLALAQQQGVEGAPGVVEARNSLTEAQRGEKEAVRNLDLAHQNLDNTLQATRRANELAGRAVDDASTALGRQVIALGEVEAATGLTTDAIKNLYDASNKLNTTFTMQVTDNGSTAITSGQMQGLYVSLGQLAQQYGITIPAWNPGVDMDKVPAENPNLPGMYGPVVPGPTIHHGGPNRAFGAGGRVLGWSPHDTADNIPAWLTADEFVINARSTRKHRGLLEAINADRAYAAGGFVLPLDRPVAKWTAPIRQNLADLLSGASGGSAAPGGASVAAVQSWLKGTVDSLPYVLGANGPSAYDCSSLVGEVWARLTGNPDYKRYFVTGTERDFLTRHGFRDGTGTFTVGFNAGHTMGNLAGLSFEAANPISGIHVGAGTSDVASFPNVMYLPQLGDRFVSVGSAVPDVSAVTVGGLWGAILRKVLTEAATANSGVAGGDPGRSSDGPVVRWRATVAQALRDNGLSTSAPFVAAVLRQIATESSGNERAVQQVHDINWPHNLARGLMQTTPGTFLRYAFPGHGDIFAGYDNLLAALNYVKHRYGGDVLGVLGHGHGYDAGGWLTDLGINTTGQPEAVLTPRESRAYVRHAEAISGDGGAVRLDDWSINRLAQALSTRPIPVHVDGRKVADAVVPHLERRF